MSEPFLIGLFFGVYTLGFVIGIWDERSKNGKKGM